MVKQITRLLNERVTVIYEKLEDSIMKPVKSTTILCCGWVAILLTVLVCQVQGAAVLDIADPDNPPSATQETVGWRTSGDFPFNLTIRLRILAGENRQIVSTTVKCIELDTSVHSELNYSLPASYYKTWTPSNNKDYRATFPAISWHYGNYRTEGSYTWRQMPGGQTGTVSATPLNIMLQPYFPQNVKSHYRPPDDYIKHVPTAHQDMGVDYYVFGYEYQNPSSNWVPMEVKFYNLD
ncbi:MAG: hypothetical protein IT210_03225, partial [Armatimonadetes bacterium]|nr:hypothetical protein [Armatimonadota bacterium]